MMMKNKITYREKYGPAMLIKSQEEADQYFAMCVEHTMSFGSSRDEAEQMERSNLAYYAGYYDNATRKRVERLFHCAHPVFGSIAENGAPSPAKAFAVGLLRRITQVKGG